MIPSHNHRGKKHQQASSCAHTHFAAGRAVLPLRGGWGLKAEIRQSGTLRSNYTQIIPIYRNHTHKNTMLHDPHNETAETARQDTQVKWNGWWWPLSPARWSFVRCFAALALAIAPNSEPATDSSFVFKPAKSDSTCRTDTSPNSSELARAELRVAKYSSSVNTGGSGAGGGTSAAGVASATSSAATSAVSKSSSRGGAFSASSASVLGLPQLRAPEPPLATSLPLSVAAE